MLCLRGRRGVFSAGATTLDRNISSPAKPESHAHCPQQVTPSRTACTHSLHLYFRPLESKPVHARQAETTKAVLSEDHGIRVDAYSTSSRMHRRGTRLVGVSYLGVEAQRVKAEASRLVVRLKVGHAQL